MDLYSGASGYLGEVPTHIVQDVCSSIHNFHPKRALLEDEELEPVFENSVRFWQTNSSKQDSAKPIAVPTTRHWVEPPLDYVKPVIEEDAKPAFTSEMDLSFWLQESGGDEI